MLKDRFIDDFPRDPAFLPVPRQILANRIEFALEFEHDQLLVNRSQLVIRELVDFLMHQRAQQLRWRVRGGTHAVSLPRPEIPGNRAFAEY
jgi:hypothetical protein